MHCIFLCLRNVHQILCMEPICMFIDDSFSFLTLYTKCQKLLTLPFLYYMMKMSRVFDIQNIKDMVDDMENSIRHRRKELGLSQEELAKKCGVSRQTVNAIENDKYDPTLALAFNLARELKTTVDELFKP